VSQIFTVPSRLALARRVLLGLNATLVQLGSIDC
jgi:hypothetical protein